MVENFNDRITNIGERQLFNTRKGRFGFTTKGVQPGDVLCVFNSASTPHVLRKVASCEEVSVVYKLVGDGYVHGLMHGEADALSTHEGDIVLV